jgi:glycosyltransferase involved in cell wall biosynthesis
MANDLKYSVVVPVYRGEKTLQALTESLIAFFNQIKQSFEIVFVYDCGPDGSWPTICKLCSLHRQVKGIRLSRNFGQHNATICGFQAARGEFIVTMDEDLQQRPEDIIFLIERQKEGDFDVVYGNYKTRKHSFFRNLTSRVLKKMLRIGIPELHPDYTSFRLIRGTLAKCTLEMNNSYTFLDGYLSWITNRFASVFVDHREREYGVSSYSTRMLIAHSVNIFVTFSKLPIRLLEYTSFLITILSFLYALYVLLRKIIYNDFISGFTTFAIMGGFGIGLILFGIGIIGEYIQRINTKTTRKPNFIAIEQVGNED